jgi:hypothetical protein
VRFHFPAPGSAESIEGYRIRSTSEIVEESTTGINPDNGWHLCRRNSFPKSTRCLHVPPGGV